MKRACRDIDRASHVFPFCSQSSDLFQQNTTFTWFVRAKLLNNLHFLYTFYQPCIYFQYNAQVKTMPACTTFTDNFCLSQVVGWKLYRKWWTRNFRKLYYCSFPAHEFSELKMFQLKVFQRKKFQLEIVQPKIFELKSFQLNIVQLKISELEISQLKIFQL